LRRSAPENNSWQGGSARARAPKLGTQTPYWHRFMLGDAQVTVVSDGSHGVAWTLLNSFP
jgi:hypothetical protein